MSGPLSGGKQGVWSDIHRSQVPLASMGPSFKDLPLRDFYASAQPEPDASVHGVHTSCTIHAVSNLQQWDVTQGFDVATDLGMPWSILILFHTHSSAPHFLIVFLLSSHADHRVISSHPLHSFCYIRFISFHSTFPSISTSSTLGQATGAPCVDNG